MPPYVINISETAENRCSAEVATLQCGFKFARALDIRWTEWRLEGTNTGLVNAQSAVTTRQNRRIVHAILDLLVDRRGTRANDFKAAQSPVGR